MFGGGLSPQLDLMDQDDGEPVATITANAVVELVVCVVIIPLKSRMRRLDYLSAKSSKRNLKT